MITKGLFTSNTDEWSTPQDFFNQLDNEFHFQLDVAASSQNAKCYKFFTKYADALKLQWDSKACFCNPPYGRKINQWVKYAYNQQKLYHNTIVMLLPARTDTKWFHEFIYNKAEIRFIKGRLHFNESKNSAPFPSMIVIYRDKK